MNQPFTPHAGYTRFAEVDHVIPNDEFPHTRSANTCSCGPTVRGAVITHNRHREYTEAEKDRIRQGDAYDPEDSEISDEIIARGTFCDRTIGYGTLKQ